MVAGVLLVIAWFGASQLRLNTDLAALLPPTFPSVSALRQLDERGEVTGYVAVVLQGSNPDELRALARRLAPKIEALDGIRYVEFERPVDWFEERALYYLEYPRLKLLAEQLRERTEWELLQHNPFYVDLENDGPPAVDVPKFERDADTVVGRRLQRRFYEDTEAGVLVLLARPVGRATKFDVAESSVREVRRIVDPLAAEAGVTARLTGRFAKKLEQKARLSEDLRNSSLLALALMLGFLTWHFRSLRGVIQVITPLVVGVGWTLGIAGYGFGQLNLLTAFIAAILLGLGIDHGIHLVTLLHENARRLNDWREATKLTFQETGAKVLAAALTTSVGFSALAVSEFRAFREFGVIAACGMVAIVTAYVVLLPALVALGDSTPLTRGASQAAPRPARLRTWWGGVTASQRLLASLVVLVVSVPMLPSLRFDASLSSLEDMNSPAFELDRLVNRVLGHSQTPTVVITSSLQEEASTVDSLRAAHEAEGTHSTLEFVMSASDLVPADQAERSTHLASIRRSLERIDLERLGAEDKSAYMDLTRMAAAPAFTRAELPTSIQRRFFPSATKVGSDSPGYVLAFPSIDLGDGAKVSQFAHQVRAPTDPDLVAGEALILADVLDMIRREGPLVLTLTIVLVIVALWGLLGGISRALMPVAAATATLIVTLSLAAWLGLPLNYLNVLMIPILFGIAVDAAVHLSAAPRDAALSETKRAIAAALLTTALGFATLLAASHPGLRSLAWLAIIGLAANAVIALVALPAIVELRSSDADVSGS